MINVGAVTHLILDGSASAGTAQTAPRVGHQTVGCRWTAVGVSLTARLAVTVAMMLVRANHGLEAIGSSLSLSLSACFCTVLRRRLISVVYVYFVARDLILRCNSIVTAYFRGTNCTDCANVLPPYNADGTAVVAPPAAAADTPAASKSSLSEASFSHVNLSQCDIAIILDSYYEH